MISSQLLNETGPLLCLREPGQAPVFFRGEATAEPALTCSFQNFYFPRRRPDDLWSGFSAARQIGFAETGALDAANAFSFPPLDLTESSPGTEEWDDYCRKISVALEKDSVQKIVPARRRTFPLSPRHRSSILNRLLARLFQPQPRAYAFLFREAGDLFFGLTPELLFRREQGALFVPAIAGTRALPANEAEATAVGEELLRSEKDRAEHAYVVTGICAALRSLGLEPQAHGGPDLLRVPGLLHLYTPITAADPGVPAEHLIRALHPTPAVGGLPQIEAADFLFDNEPWNRGLFASPLLLRFPQREICLVTIRSGLLREDSLHLFAGAGYVKGSNAAGEWRETERKTNVLASLLFGASDDKK